MKKRFALFTLALATPVVAWTDWYCCDLNCNFAIGAEAIYWRPCVDSFLWGSRSNEANSVIKDTPFSIQPDYQWGFRIFGAVSDQCEENAVLLSWTYLYTSDNAVSRQIDRYYRFNGDHLNVDFAKVKERFRYHNVKLYGMHDFCKQCDSRCYAYAGGRYVYVRDRRKAQGSTSAVSLRDELTSKFSGGGIAVGLGGEVGLWCGFGLTFEAGIAGLVGAAELNLQSKASGDSLQSHKLFDSHTVCLPGIDAKFGVTWGTSCWCWTFDLEVGYQIEHYFDMLLLPTSNVNPVLSGINLRNASFAGPYFGVTLSY